MVLRHLRTPREERPVRKVLDRLTNATQALKRGANEAGPWPRQLRELVAHLDTEATGRAMASVPETVRADLEAGLDAFVEGLLAQNGRRHRPEFVTLLGEACDRVSRINQQLGRPAPIQFEELCETDPRHLHRARMTPVRAEAQGPAAKSMTSET